MVEDVSGVGFAQGVHSLRAEAAEFVGDEFRVGLAFARGHREGSVVGLRVSEQLGQAFRRMGGVGRQVDGFLEVRPRGLPIGPAGRVRPAPGVEQGRIGLVGPDDDMDV